MRRLPWLEIILIIALAVALIVKPKPNEIRAQPQDDPSGRMSGHTAAASSIARLGYR